MSTSDELWQVLIVAPVHAVAAILSDLIHSSQLSRHLIHIQRHSTIVSYANCLSFSLRGDTVGTGEIADCGDTADGGDWC